MIKSQMSEEDQKAELSLLKKDPFGFASSKFQELMSSFGVELGHLGASSMLETGSSTESSAAYEQRMMEGAKRMRSAQGKQMLQLAEQYAVQIEKDTKDAEKKFHDMMDKMMVMTMEQRQPYLEDYEKIKEDYAKLKKEHEAFDRDTDAIYSMMAK